MVEKKLLHYSRSPLTEAIIDIRVKISRDIKLEDLGAIHSEVKEKYPNRQDRTLVQGEIVAGLKSSSASASQEFIGYRYTSTDSRQVAQTRLDGFTFSRLAPYENWESFRDEARLWWNRYSRVTKPGKILRVAVRYINRIELPLPVNDFKDYLKTVPEISPELNQNLDGYFMQLQIPQKDLKATLILNEAIASSTKPNSISVLLDIDIFRATEVNINNGDIWNYFERLRNRKNEIFEGCITEKTRELIK